MKPMDVYRVDKIQGEVVVGVTTEALALTGWMVKRDSGAITVELSLKMPNSCSDMQQGPYLSPDRSCLLSGTTFQL